MDLGVEHVLFEEGLDFVTMETPENLHNGEAPISDLEVCASTTAQKDNNTSLESTAFLGTCFTILLLVSIVCKI